LENRKIPVIIVDEIELPIFIFLVGKKRKMKTYCALSNSRDGFYLKKCNGKNIF